MKNPWLELKRNAPYVLKEDKKIIEQFNKKAKREHKIALNALPVPFQGNPFKAKIIFLQLNPGLDWPIGYEDEKDDFVAKFDKKYKNDTFKNIKHQKLDFPFYDLNPNYRLYGGFRYWTKILSSFIKSKGDYKIISNNICCIEYFPYHSKKFSYGSIKLKNQDYIINLLKNILKRKNIKIILMKGEKTWLKAVPELKGNYISLNSKRNVVLSRKNLGKNFNKIEKIIKK